HQQTRSPSRSQQQAHQHLARQHHSMTWVKSCPPEIPTLEDLQASHRRMMATQGTLAEQVKQHGVMLDRFVAAQQQSGSH
ncbi:unnamed protein product, partial [Ranitomeya imitator]